MGATIGFVLSSIAIAVVVACYLWLDRWEPEPPRLLITAFLWGASVAIILSLALELVHRRRLSAAPGATGRIGDSFDSAALRAPLIEEAAKGLFLLIMMTGRRRNELNSLTDCLVYAGLVGRGFRLVRGHYLHRQRRVSLAASLFTAALRLVMAPFAHSLFTVDARDRGVLRAASSAAPGRQSRAASWPAISGRCSCTHCGTDRRWSASRRTSWSTCCG